MHAQNIASTVRKDSKALDVLPTEKHGHIDWNAWHLDDRAVFPVVLPLPFEERRPPRRVALRGAKKLVEAHADFGLVSDALYDVVEDPDEARDRAADLPEFLGSLRADLAAYRASVESAPRSLGKPEDIDAKTRAQLEVLGYAK